ncbi:MAG: peptidoglycan-binding protein [bacterium]|nr:peptidoglycan-binding protein [bacterium]
MKKITLSTIFILLLNILTLFLFPQLIFAQQKNVVAPTSIADIEALLKIVQTLTAQVEALKEKIEVVRQSQFTGSEVLGTVDINVAILMRQLGIGMSGNDVRVIQEILAKDPTLYPEGLITGYFGSATFRAVQRFQRKNDLDPVGTVGPKTLAKLNGIIVMKQNVALITQPVASEGTYPPASSSTQITTSVDPIPMNPTVVVGVASTTNTLNETTQSSVELPSDTTTLSTPTSEQQTLLPDVTSPVITVTTALSSATSSQIISIQGSAHDPQIAGQSSSGVTSITWLHGSSSGVAVGMSNWTIENITLVIGSNTIILAVHDGAGNTTSQSIGIIYTPPTVSAVPDSPIAQYVRQCALTKTPIQKNVFGLSIVPSYSQQYFDLLSDLGVKWVRAEFYWSEIERSDGTYDWTAYDIFVKEMNRRGISILGVINYIPKYITTWDIARTQFAKFSGAVAERYKQGGTFAQAEGWQSYGIQYWEIFNEPNLPGYGWLSQGQDPRQFLIEYVGLLAIGNSNIRAIDSSAVVVLGGLSPEGMPYKDFLTSLYGYGAQKCFDVLAFHPYGRGGRFASVASELQGIASTNNDVGKEIWFNEYGTSDDSIRDSLIQKMFEERNTIGGLFWFSLRNLKSIGWNFGLVQYNFTKKPSYTLFKDLLLTSGP